MSYLVLARKYRPLTFSTVSGQEHVTRTLANAIKRNKIAHAYIFAGPRGVGKTSIARIFAKALNCKQGPTPEPCLECPSCREIADGSGLAVREIDGASHNSVDNVRELIESFRSLPPPGSLYKIYIIDEVHMLSTAAFNALLKSLEEPPPHTMFILATTEAHKIPDTVISRCQRFDFRALAGKDIEACLHKIAEDENMTVEPEAFRMIARQAEGSMRDAQSLLDRVQSFCEGEITAADTEKVLGIVKRSTLFEISAAVFARDAARVLTVLDEIFGGGVDPALFLREFVMHWRELVLAKFGGETALKRIGAAPDYAAELLRQTAEISRQDVIDLVQLAREGADVALRSMYPKYALESLLVRMASRESVKDLGVILGKLKNLIAKDGGAAKKTEGQPESAAVKAAAQPRPAPSSPAQAKSAPAAKVEPAPTEAKPVRSELDWADFVQYASQSGALMVSENVKRLAVSTFAPKVLEAKGPPLSVAYLLERDNLGKLRGLLESYSKQTGWAIKLTNGSGTKAEAGSLAAQEESGKLKKRSEQVETIKNHPAVQSLKKAFPGTTIENIKLKE